MSAPRPGALPSIFSLEPGTARHVRRGRFRERSDMRGEGRRPPPAEDAGRSLGRMTDDLSLTELGDGVYAWLQPGGETGRGERGRGRRRRRHHRDRHAHGAVAVGAVRGRSRRRSAFPCAARCSPTRTSTTCGGTKAFPHAAVYGSQQTSDVLDRRCRSTRTRQFMPAFEEEFDDLAELGTRPVTHLVDGAAQLTPRVELLPAEGHTEGDLLVLVADTDVCFAGDLCFFGVTPLAFQGEPGGVGRHARRDRRPRRRDRARTRPGRRRGRGARAPGLPVGLRRRRRRRGQDPAGPVGHLDRP